MLVRHLPLLVTDALVEAAKMEGNAVRSQAFVNHLAASIKKNLSKIGCVGEAQVAWRSSKNEEIIPNGKDNIFIGKIREFLCDIGVFRIRKCRGYLNREVKYVEYISLAVESELSRNAAEIMIDFRKLRVIQAEWKIFIGTRIDPKRVHWKLC
jgi:hypothetical protein